MNIKIYCVGKIKEKYLKQGIEEYSKRLRTYYNVEIQEVADEKAPEKMSLAEMEQIKKKEGEKVLKKLKETDYVFALAINGKQLSSEEFAKAMDQLGIEGKKQIVFIIGGSLGLSTELLQRANQQLSFGKLTYPHQLMRLVLIEQIYRVARINSGHTYHK